MSSETDEEDGDWYCCDDDWSVWLRFETWIWAVLLLVQLSMAAFLVIHGRKDKSFSQAFYVLFVAVTLVDCALTLLRPSVFEETIFGTAYDEPFIERTDPRTHEIVFYPTIRSTVNNIIKHAVVPALGHAQPLFLMAIAANRFTAFAFPLKHATIWRTRTVAVVTTCLAAISIILGAATPVVLAIHQAVTCSRATKKQRKQLFCDTYEWAFAKTFIPAISLTLNSTICCVISFALNIGSISMLIALRTTGRMQRKGPELQLFAHSLWMFLLQLLLALQDVVYFTDNPDYIVDELGLERIGITWADFRHSSEWLAGFNATRTWSEDGYGFTPGCSYWAPEEGEKESLPKCQVWYALLVGKLILRDDPHFTVLNLEQWLFVLSGSVFLLIISGNVRAAYFDFYFKWRCLKKACGQRSSVKIIRATIRRAPTTITTTPVMSIT